MIMMIMIMIMIIIMINVMEITYIIKIISNSSNNDISMLFACAFVLRVFSTDCSQYIEVQVACFGVASVC